MLDDRFRVTDRRSRAGKQEARRREKRESRIWFRKVPRGVGYQCPRCWKWFATAAERAEHRSEHWKKEGA